MNDVSNDIAVEEKIKWLFGKLRLTNKHIEEDAEDYTLPDNPAELLASYEHYADNLADEIPQKHSLQCFVRMAKNSLEDGDEAGLKVNLLKFQTNYTVARRNELVIFDAAQAEEME